MTTQNKEKCYLVAMQLLSRREHSTLELTQKLSNQTFNTADIEHVIQTLIKKNYQSDERFATEFIQMRFNQGKGSIKISIDLKQRGIYQFDLSKFDFFKLIKQIRTNKFGINIPNNYKDQSKQKRFLQYREFDFEQIKQAFSKE